MKPKRINKKHFFETTNFYKIVLGLCCIFNSYLAIAQQKINWVDFEDLPSLQAQNPKPIFIYIYADWCVYCKKMERATFRDSENVTLLNKKYYALKFDLETAKNIQFNGKTYKNNEVKTQRNPVHELAKHLSVHKNKDFSLPALFLLDENYKRLQELHTYLSPQDFKLLINQY